MLVRALLAKFITDMKKYFFLFLVGWDSPIGTAATIGLLYQPQIIDDECGAVDRMKIGRGNRSTRKKPAPVPLCPPQIPHDPSRWEASDWHLSYGTDLWRSKSLSSKNADRFPLDLGKARILHGRMWSLTHHLHEVGLQIAMFIISLISIASYALPIFCIYMEIKETRIKPLENISCILMFS
jgi:hypothetical protein